MTSPANKDRLDQLVRRERTTGVHLLFAGDSSFLSSCYENLVKGFKEQQNGILLGTNESADLNMINIRVPLDETKKRGQVGRGFISRRGRFRRFQAALPPDLETGFEGWTAKQSDGEKI
jgi:hypothetical protein